MPTIDQLHRRKTGKVSDKWASYLTTYDRLLLPYREAPVALLEVGVQNGGSLETWAQYFPHGRAFVGCDIDPRCGTLTYDDPRIHVVVGDVNSPEAMAQIQAHAGAYDLVVDDGSHQSGDILAAFLNYFPLVAPGGLYVVEDTHTLYQEAYGGGLFNEASALALFKKLTDVVNHEFWRQELSIATYLQTFFAQLGVPAFLEAGWVEAVEFRNSMVCITKARTPGHAKLGTREVHGQQALYTLRSDAEA